MLRLEAKEVLAQLQKERVYRLRYSDPDKVYRNRIDKIAAIKDGAIDFCYTIFTDFELPSTPNFQVVAIKGFEDALRDDFLNMPGVVVIATDFTTQSGHKIAFDIPIPIARGEFHRPSIMVFQGKRLVLSQEMLAKLASKFESVRPAVSNMYSAQPRTVTHQPNQEKPPFAAPIYNSAWNDLVFEVY